MQQLRILANPFERLLVIEVAVSEEWIAKWRVKNPDAFFVPGAVVPGMSPEGGGLREAAPLTYVDHWSY